MTDLHAVKTVHFEPQLINILLHKPIYSRFRIPVELYQQVVLLNLSSTSMGRPSRAHGEGMKFHLDMARVPLTLKCYDRPQRGVFNSICFPETR
jgi:hypothetical protein